MLHMRSQISFRLRLTKDGDEWVYSLRTKPTGVFKLTGKGKIQETSVFVAAPSSNKLEIQTQQYTYRQDKEAKRSVDASFDWNNNALTYQRRGREETLSFSEPVVDRFAVTLAIIDELKQGDFKEVTLKVFDNGTIKTTLFTNEGVETVKTRLGTHQAIRVKSIEAGGAVRYISTWFAPDLNYLPVKIEQYKRDKLVARLKLTALR